MRRIAAILVTAAVALSGCDRVVNLTPFYDAPPNPDGNARLDAGPILDAGGQTPDDGSPIPDDGNPSPYDGNPVLDGAR